MNHGENLMVTAAKHERYFAWDPLRWVRSRVCVWAASAAVWIIMNESGPDVNDPSNQVTAASQL